MDRTDEAVVQIAVLAYLADGQVRDNQQIKQNVAKTLKLTKPDVTRAKHRPNEPKWHQIVNNALSPSRSSSLYGKGLVENCGTGRHRITAAGLLEVQRNEMWASLVMKGFEGWES